jgi:hypothetical protein
MIDVVGLRRQGKMAYLLNYYYVVNEWDLGFAFLLFFLRVFIIKKNFSVLLLG